MRRSSQEQLSVAATFSPTGNVMKQWVRPQLGRTGQGTNRQAQSTLRAALKRISSELNSPISISRKKTL